MKAVFFGNNLRIVEVLLTKLHLVNVVSEVDRVNDSVVDLCFLRGIGFHAVSGVDELSTDFLANHDLGVTCGFGLIFRREHIKATRLGIVNIHFGRLPGYRSRHPVSWAFLNNEFEIGVSIHRIDHRIDCGRMLHRFSVQRHVDDTLSDIENRICDRFDLAWDVAQANLVNGRTEAIAESNYLPTLATKLRRIDPAEHPARYLLNAFRSQREYGGIEIDGKRYTLCHVHHPNRCWDGWLLRRSADGVDLAFR